MNKPINKTKQNIDWAAIENNYQKIMRGDRLGCGDQCKVINLSTNESEIGIIVFQNDSWRELQIDNDFKIFSFFNHKFTKWHE